MTPAKAAGTAAAAAPALWNVANKPCAAVERME